MKNWDFATGASKLEEALDSLDATWKQTSEYWNDPTSRKFEEEYLLPLEPRARRALDAIHRIVQVFAKAQRECSDE